MPQGLGFGFGQGGAGQGDADLFPAGGPLRGRDEALDKVDIQHVFDPPPDHLAIPWAYLGELAGAALAATSLAIAITVRRLRELPLGRLLREQ